MTSIFARFDDLEKRIDAIASVPVGAVPSVPATTFDPSELLQRLAAIEEKLQMQPDISNITNRLDAIESKLLPAEEKIDNLENAVSAFRPVITANSADIQTLNNKIVHLETVTLPHILSRIENLEHKVTESDQ